MARIDCFCTTLSPFTCPAGTRANDVAARHGAEPDARPPGLAALFARTGGTMLAERHAARQEYRAQDPAGQARRRGLPLNPGPAHFPTGAAPSCHAVIAAAGGGGGDMGRLVHAFPRACRAEERDTAEDAVIRAGPGEAGFDAGPADAVLSANPEPAVERGAFGATFCITDEGQRFRGQGRLRDLDLYLSGAP